MFLSLQGLALASFPTLFELQTLLCNTTLADTSESDPAADDERAALAEFVARWSLSDLYYRNEELDKALDLIAICSMGNSANNLAASNH